MSFFSSSSVADESWGALVTDANEYLSTGINTLKRDYKLGEHERFDWDQETGSLVFSNDGAAAVIAKVQFVGSISTTSNTWLWSWGNSTILDNVRDQMETVKRFGEHHNYQALTTEKWEADEVDGWEMTAIAAQVLQAKGGYRTNSNNGFTYMVITDIKWAE